MLLYFDSEKEKDEYYHFLENSCEKENYVIPGLPSCKGAFRIIKKGLTNEDYKRLKQMDETYYDSKMRHRFANFLPDDERPDWIFVPDIED